MSDQSSEQSAPLTDATRALFFTYDFGADGLLCAEGAERTWTFRAYMTSDIRTRQAVAADPALPVAVKEAFLPAHVPIGWISRMAGCMAKCQTFGTITRLRRMAWGGSGSPSMARPLSDHASSLSIP